jgi:hypothetical protein
MQVLTHLAGAVCLVFIDMDKDCAIFRRQSLRQAAQMAGIVMCKDQIGYVQMLPAPPWLHPRSRIFTRCTAVIAACGEQASN